MKLFITNSELQEILNISKSSAYQRIKQMNDELEAEGYHIVRGKVPIEKFYEKYPYLRDRLDVS